MQNPQILSVFAIALSSLLAPSAARAESLIHPSEDYSLDAGVGVFQPSLGFYSTSSNKNADGQASTPVGLQSLSRMRITPLLALAPIQRLTLFGRLEWVRMSVTTSTVSATGYGLGDQMIGAAYRLIDQGEKGRNGLHLAFQIKVDIPMYDNARSATDGTPYLGDGSLDFTPSFAAWFPMGSGDDRATGISGAIGYWMRGEGFSKAIPWHAQVRSRPRIDGLLFSAGVNGVQSLNNDALTDTTTSITSSTGGGGSALIHAINPSIVNLAGTLGYQLSPSSALELSITKSIYGKSAPVGMEIAAGFTYRWHSELMASSERPLARGEFVRHSLEAKVLRANDRLNLVRIDKGTADGVEVGQYFDLFENPENSRTPGKPVARARATSVKADEAALSVVEYYREIWIDEGFVAKRLVQ